MTTAHPQRIAVVEDAFPTAQLLRDIVEGFGHVVGEDIYYRPPDPGDGFWRKPPDLVLCDVFFAGQPLGLAFCRRLAECAVPFFLVSAGEPEDILGHLGTLRPLGIIHKPLRPRDIFSRIELALRRGLPARRTPAAQTMTLRDRGLKVEVPLADVSHVESDRNHCIIYAGERRYVALASLKGLLAEYAASALVQIHRSYLIHLDHVRGYNATEVALDGGARVPIGRHYRAGFLARVAEREPAV